MRVLGWVARYGRWALVVGLIVGIALPSLAEAMRPMIAPLVTFLLFLAMLRLGPNGLRKGFRDVRMAIGITLGLQLILPLAAILFLGAAGVLVHPLAVGLVLMLAAAPITGSPHIAAMSGVDPAPAVRQMVVGTALLPLTSLPVFWLMPAFGSSFAAVVAGFSLLAVIIAAGGAAVLLRRTGVVPETAEVTAAVDGISALSLAIVVIGLMSAVGPAIGALPDDFFSALGLAFAANLALQAGAYALTKRFSPTEAGALAIVAGNRNVALFLAILPPEVAAPLLLFIGCYQIPMYLTPMIMRPLLMRS